MNFGPMLIALFCLIIGCLVSSLMFALRGFSFRRLEEIAERNGGLSRVAPILDDPDAYALSMGAARVVCNVAAIVTIVLAFDPATIATVVGVGGDSHPTAAMDYTRLTLAGAVALVLVYILNVLVPHAVAEHAGERLIHSLTTFIRATHFCAAPLRTLGFVEVAVKRLARQDNLTEEEEREEEILSAVSEGEHEGTVQEAERAMIENVVEFWSTTVEEVMTPRTEIEGFELTDDLEFIRAFIEKAGHSRIPVYEGNLDHIIGILYAKDLLGYLGRDASAFSLRPVLRTTLFVPESKLISELLLEMQSRKIHLAVVLDEYGGTAGLITVEDLLEEIVGEIQDEYEPEHEQPPVIEVSPEKKSAEIEARAYIGDANEALESIGITIPEHEEYDTVGGFVLSQLGRIPSAGETFTRDGFDVTILEAEPTRVHKLRISVPAPADREAREEARTGATEEPIRP